MCQCNINTIHIDFMFLMVTGVRVRMLSVEKPVSCLSESGNKLVVGQGGMECFGTLFDLNTGVCALWPHLQFFDICSISIFTVDKIMFI